MDEDFVFHLYQNDVTMHFVANPLCDCLQILYNRNGGELVSFAVPSLVSFKSLIDSESTPQFS